MNMPIDSPELLALRVEELESYFEEVELKCKKLHPDAILPTNVGDGNIGWDFYCVADNEFFEVVRNCIDCGEKLKAGSKVCILNSGATHIFHTGLACMVSSGFALQLWDRSGMATKKNIHRLAGIIDSSYRGEIMVVLTNLSKTFQVIKAGDRIIQGIIARDYKAHAYWVDELNNTQRGDRGFGSTGD